MFPLTTIVWDHLNAKKHLCNDKYIFMEKTFPHGKLKSAKASSVSPWNDIAQQSGNSNSFLYRENFSSCY